MFRKLVLAMGCVLLGSWVMAPAVGAQRGTPPPEVPPTSPPPAETPPDTTAPPDTAPPPVTAPPDTVPPEASAEPSEEERPRVFAGVVIEPPAPAPVATRPPAPAPRPVRLPFSGAGGTALPLAGAALALGGLGIIAGQPGRPATGAGTVPVTGTGQVRLLHQRDAAPTPSRPRRRGGDGRLLQPRLRRG
jgi:hypothetical protein